jgi:hypothetical protein
MKRYADIGPLVGGARRSVDRRTSASQAAGGIGALGLESGDDIRPTQNATRASELDELPGKQAIELLGRASHARIEKALLERSNLPFQGGVNHRSGATSYERTRRPRVPGGRRCRPGAQRLSRATDRSFRLEVGLRL